MSVLSSLHDVYALFDYGVTHSFILTKLALSISSVNNRTLKILRTSLALSEILLLEFFLRSSNGHKFDFKERSLLNHKMIISYMQAQMMLVIRCMGFLALVVGKSKEKKIDPTEVPVVKKFVEVFPKKVSGLLLS